METNLTKHILLRLPVKSLLRFKCVRKSWLTLISDSQFAKSLYDLTEPTYRLLVKPKPADLSVSIDLEASLHDDSVIAYLTTPLPSSPSVDPSSYFQIYGSCRGFILQRYHRDDNLILWNPSTGAHKLIQYPDYVRNNEFLFGFGYDKSMDDYLVVIWQWCNPSSSWDSDIHLFSFKTNSWNKIEGMDFPTGKDYDSVFRAGLFFNEALHWLACCNNPNRSSVIVAFDMMGRSLSEIPLPPYLTMLMKTDNLYNLVVIGGCLSLCKGWQMDDMMSAKVDIWMMKEYKVQTSWTTVSVRYTCGIVDFSPVWFTKGGDIVVGSDESGALMKLDDEGKPFEYRRCNKELVEYMFLRKPQSAIYRESLLSLPDLGEARDDQQ